VFQSPPCGRCGRVSESYQPPGYPRGTHVRRANPTPSISGIFAGDGSATATVADTRRHWSIFHGLPVIDARGVVVFRADRKDGVPGIYAWDAGSIRTVVETGDLFSTLGHFHR
jgi:hypothetical protein